MNPIVGHVINPREVKRASHFPAANTAAVVTLAALTNADARRVLTSVEWSYNAAPTGGTLSVAVGTGPTTIWQVDITAAGPGGFGVIIPTTNPGEQIVVTLAAAGAAVTGRLNVGHITVPA